MNIKEILKHLYINSKLEKIIEKLELKVIDDKKKVEIIENVIEDRPKKAVRYAKEIQNPQTKIDTLENIVSNIKNDNVIEILNTLPNKEMSRIIETDEIIGALKDGYYKEQIIVVLRTANTENEKLQGVYTFIDSLSDLEISDFLESTNNEEMKKKIIKRKITDDYQKYGNVLHVDSLIQSLAKKEDIIEVVEESVDKIDEDLKEKKSYLDGKIKNEIRGKFFYYAYYENEEENRKLEKMKLNKIDEYYKNGELNYGGLYELINKGIRNKHCKAIAIEKYRDKQIKRKEDGKITQEELFSQEQLNRLYETLEERDKFILKYSNGKMLVNENNFNFMKNKKSEKNEIER